MIQRNLEDVLEQELRAYSEAIPYPHAVIDGLFDEDVLNKVLASFENLERSPGLTNTFKTTEVKFSSVRGDSAQNLACKEFLRYLNSSNFIDFLQKLTGIKEPLIPDPHFIGAGLHLIKKGGFLKVHADFAKHTETLLDRRVNVLIYLNHGWDKSYGGNFEMWDDQVTKCMKSVEPIFNRTVIFNTTDYTYHGHPDPLSCPSDIYRKSIALYYYSNGRPEAESRSLEKNQSTLFVERPGESFGIIKERSIRDLAYLAMQALTPPIIFSKLKRLRSTIINQKSSN